VMNQLNAPLVLASGSSLRNRIVKAAMEEQLAGRGQQPDDRIANLYSRWASGGAGLLITGHVMVDRRAVAQPGDIVLDSTSAIDPFVTWAKAAHVGGTKIWMQINHPGRVVQRDTKSLAWAPSVVPIDAGSFSSLYPVPVAMTSAQIRETIANFASTAGAAERAGFDGVEVHAAHGYLISQFLSPLVNKRDDEWGGTLENRARLLLEVVAAIRSATSPGFAVAVKLNSADFQRGGFDFDDARQVIDLLETMGTDLVELSGGSIESLATSGTPTDGRTLAREAYFLQLTSSLAESAPVPLMLTGGIRRGEVAQAVIDAGFSLVGVATALAVDPTAPTPWLRGQDSPIKPPASRVIRSKMLRSAAVQASLTLHLHHLARGRQRARPLPPAIALLRDRIRRGAQLRAYRRRRTA
jgi:2,4-dienoyl-CoA reductase-like NADH-dependent reductase (Old Yellow Enzyme family)